MGLVGTRDGPTMGAERSMQGTSFKDIVRTCHLGPGGRPRATGSLVGRAGARGCPSRTDRRQELVLSGRLVCLLCRMACNGLGLPSLKEPVGTWMQVTRDGHPERQGWSPRALQTPCLLPPGCGAGRAPRWVQGTLGRDRAGRPRAKVGHVAGGAPGLQSVDQRRVWVVQSTCVSLRVHTGGKNRQADEGSRVQGSFQWPSQKPRQGQHLPSRTH